jgi:hypothetical protein
MKGVAIGFDRNLIIDLVGYMYEILVMILYMENGIEAYSMFLGTLWLKQVKLHHNWGDNTLEHQIVMFSTIKHVNIKSSQ